MENVYLVCMILGIVFPLLSLVFDIFDDVLDALFSGLEFLDFDGADVDLWFLPLSANSIFGFLLFFGGSGRLLKYTGKSNTTIFLIACVIGYIAAIIIQSLIRKLKKIESPSINVTDLLMYEGKVENEIAEQGFGSVSFWIHDRVVTYPAKSFDGHKISQEATVKVKEIQDQNVLVVEYADSLLKKYEE